MDTSRRNFLKASTATGLLAMTYAPGTLGAVGAKALEGGDKTVYSFCEMCSSRCPIEAKVVDGKNVFIQGNGKVSGTATSVCARGRQRAQSALRSAAHRKTAHQSRRARRK